MTQKFPSKVFALPKKHFAFGNLDANSTSYYPGNTVPWVWHVAPIVRLNDSKLYVLDPALSSDAVEKEEWYKLMMATPESEISGFVTCEPYTYLTTSSCFKPKQLPDENAHCDIQGYLDR